MYAPGQLQGAGTIPFIFAHNSDGYKRHWRCLARMFE